MGGRPTVAYQACRHAAERGQDQQDRQYRDAFAQCVNHGFSLAVSLLEIVRLLLVAAIQLPLDNAIREPIAGYVD